MHLAAITKILEDHKSVTEDTISGFKPTVTLVDGPFEGLKIPHTSAKANAAYITRSLVDTYLITHPHLDHISGFVVNTAALPGVRPKRLAGLPFTIDAFRNHIFNNVIWPNLSDENNGAGLVTYMRLIEGGSPALGNGEGKGYVEVCEGLGVKGWGVSHGHCIERHSHRGSSQVPQAEMSPRSNPSLLPNPHNQRPNAGGRSNSTSSFQSDKQARDETVCVYDSSTYFIRDVITGKEVIIFGDVEADSLSLSPRNKRIWSEAAPKIVHDHLTGIFIECSYDNSREVDLLFGHLAPKFLMEELKTLAEEVSIVRGRTIKKRKRTGNGSAPRRKNPSRTSRDQSPQHSTTRSQRSNSNHKNFEFEVTRLDNDVEQVGFSESPTKEGDSMTTLAIHSRNSNAEDAPPLQGVRIILIHVKDKLDDRPDVGEKILRELREQERELRLGCEFILAKAGQALYF